MKPFNEYGPKEKTNKYFMIPVSIIWKWLKNKNKKKQKITKEKL